MGQAQTKYRFRIGTGNKNIGSVFGQAKRCLE